MSMAPKATPPKKLTPKQLPSSPPPKKIKLK